MNNSELKDSSKGKRKSDPSQWKQNVRKRFRTAGLQYTNAKGDIVPEKNVGSDCNCKKKCMQKLSEDQTDSIFRRLYHLDNKDQQDTFLQGLIEAHEVVRRRKRSENSTRAVEATFTYHAMVGDIRTVVCLKAFCSLHATSPKQVRRLQKLLLLDKFPKDERGKNPKTFALPPETLLLIREHVESFPTHRSHYSGTVIEYLDERLNVKKLYNMFKAKHPEVEIGFTSYYTYFKKQFNLKFGQPQVDCCSTCESLKVKLRNPHLGDAAKRVADAELTVHKRRAQKFYNKLKLESENTENSKVLAICFDYMQNLTVPLIPVQETFYLCQINVNVFGIHNIKENTAKIYLYHEGEAKKGPNEVCSFLMDFLKNDAPATAEELHIYSDNCGGQNKNHALSRCLCALTDTGRFKKIEHYYPVRGHSFLPCDRDFSQIKKSLKQVNRLYTIKEIIRRIVHSSSKIDKYTVKRIKTSDIIDYKNWWPHYYTKTPVSEETRGKGVKKNQKVYFGITSFSQFSYSSEIKGVTIAHTMIDGILKQTFRLRNNMQGPPLLPAELAYSEKIPLKQKKVEDVKKLTEYIPEKYRKFFNVLTSWPTMRENDDNENED